MATNDGPADVHPRDGAAGAATAFVYGSCSGEPRFQDFVANLIGVLDGAREVMLNHAVVEASYFDETMATFRAWSYRPDAALWYAICWAEGVREP